MRKIKVLLFVTAICVSTSFIGILVVQAETSSAFTGSQVVPTTKRVSRKVYRKGRWVTVTTWKHGKRITKKVWHKGNSIGHKTATKTKEIIMGPAKRVP